MEIWKYGIRIKWQWRGVGKILGRDFVTNVVAGG